MTSCNRDGRPCATTRSRSRPHNSIPTPCQSRRAFFVRGGLRRGPNRAAWYDRSQTVMVADGSGAGTRSGVEGDTDISIVIVSRNTRELLRACLRSIAAHADDLAIEVIVVDSDSSDGSAAMVRRQFPEVV